MKYVFISLLVTLMSCQGSQISTKDKEGEFTNSKTEYKEIEDAYNFYVIGDWGRNGSAGQVATAKQMTRTASSIEPEFIISVGDNFYPNGVASTSDPLWKNSFEDVYKDEALQCDWYTCIGNHDIRGSVQAQIDYSEISRRWNLPDWYYSFEKTLEDDSTKALFVFIDTNPFQYTGFSSKYYSKVQDQDTTAQKIWLKKVLASSDAKWKIVVGHHPMYTGGKRVKGTEPIISSFRNLFEEYGVDIYFCGHEHDLQLLKEQDRKTTYVVSGAGSKIRKTGNMKYTKFSAAENGFFTASMTRDSIYLQAIGTLDNVLYSYSVK